MTMENKIIVLIILLIIVLAGVFAYFNLSQGSFANSKVAIPDGFEVTRQNGTEIVMTNGITNYSVKELNENKKIPEYLDDCYSKYDENDTVINKTQNIADKKVKVMVLKDDNNKTIHAYYFFESNDKIYRLFTKGKYNKTAIESIINSTV